MTVIKLQLFPYSLKNRISFRMLFEECKEQAIVSNT